MSPKLKFFGFETNQDTGTHQPNLGVVQKEMGVVRVFCFKYERTISPE